MFLPRIAATLAATLVLAVSLALAGSPVGLEPPLIMVLVPFAGFAVAGGAVASVAYSEARRRR